MYYFTLLPMYIFLIFNVDFVSLIYPSGSITWLFISVVVTLTIFLYQGRIMARKNQNLDPDSGPNFYQKIKS